MPRKKKSEISTYSEVEPKKNKKNIMNTMVSNKEEHIILQLPINETNIDNIINNNKNENEPMPYEKESFFNSDNKIIENISTEENGYITKINANNFNNDKEYYNSNRNRNSHCYWCVHPIEYIVFSMPINFDNISNTYICYGSFCSLQCANAYNFSVNSGSDKVWEINSLIQMLGKLYKIDIPIRPAPSRYLLNIFSGGKLTIEEYRKLHLNHDSSHVLNLPPMINISSAYEKINTSYAKSLSETIKIGGITSQFNQNENNREYNNTDQYRINEKMNLIINKK
tara:strand:+ start:218 stop:1066 length:849 start_codon:yes stop_codon:yes gene_type:complete